MTKAVDNSEKENTKQGGFVFLANMLATGFYSGLFPKAPGTAGSLAAMLLLVLLYYLFPASQNWEAAAVLAVVTTVIGTFAAQAVLNEGIYGEEQEDPKQIVIDEFAGYYVSVIGLGFQPERLLVAFILFRIFDILKPPPISHAERLPGGFGIMADDLAAGAYALVLTHAVFWIL